MTTRRGKLNSTGIELSDQTSPSQNTRGQTVKNITKRSKGKQDFKKPTQHFPNKRKHGNNGEPNCKKAKSRLKLQFDSIVEEDEVEEEVVEEKEEVKAATDQKVVNDESEDLSDDTIMDHTYYPDEVDDDEELELNDEKNKVKKYKKKGANLPPSPKKQQTQEMRDKETAWINKLSLKPIEVNLMKDHARHTIFPLMKFPTDECNDIHSKLMVSCFKKLSVDLEDLDAKHRKRAGIAQIIKSVLRGKRGYSSDNIQKK